MPKSAILPNLLTLGNAVCGFAAIASPADWQGRHHRRHQSLLPGHERLAHHRRDGLRRPRWLRRPAGTHSEFGAELDSLCDAISFGAAPAFLLLQLGQDWKRRIWHRALAAVAALYMVCAILRLARFNVENLSGWRPASQEIQRPALPGGGRLPGLAGHRARRVAGLARVQHADRSLSAIEIGRGVGRLLVALLMVSRVPYPHFTNQLLGGRRRFDAARSALVLVSLLSSAPRDVLAVLVLVYALDAARDVCPICRRPCARPSAAAAVTTGTE